MKSQRMTRVMMIVGSVCLLVAAGFIYTRQEIAPKLPALISYQGLPAAFDQALRKTRAFIHDPAHEPEQVRKLARLYQANRLYSEARACYVVLAATSNGLSARDQYYLADIARNEGDLNTAEQKFKTVLEVESGYLPAHLALAEAFFKSGQEEAAVGEYSKVVAIEENNPRALIGLVRIDLQRGNDEAAVARLGNLMASHPESTAGAALLAQVLERRGETERASAMREWSRQKPEPIPPDPWLDALLVDCYDLQRLSLLFEEYFKTGQMTEALPLLDRLAELDPKSPIPKMFNGFSHARSLEHVTAVREYYEALGKGGDPEKIVPLLVTSLLALGKLSEASSLLTELHNKMPDSIPITSASADVAVRQGDDKAARILLTKVLEKEPYVYAPNMSLAKILWQAGERDEAVKCLQRVGQVFPADVASRGLLGQYYLEKGDFTAAITPLEQALAHSPDQTVAREHLAAMLAAAYLQAGNAEGEKGNLSGSLDFYGKAIPLSPADLKAYAGKAAVAVQLKRFDLAADALEKMSALQPDNPTIYLSLGDVLYQAGDGTKARLHWQKALQLTAVDDGELRRVIEDRVAGRLSTDTFK